MQDKMEYFIERTDKHLDEIKDELETLNEKINDLDKFRFKIIGMALGVSLVCTVFVNILVIVLKTK